MGLKGGKNGNWKDIVAKTRSDERERIAKGFPPRLAEWKSPGTENVKSTKVWEDWKLSHQTQVDEKMCILPSSDRGKRRHARRQQGN
jgi:hypothetical protein